MFKKVLIANRGEIAVRVIRACRELGIKTVAVYSTADRSALHAQIADEAVCIGGPAAKDSYLNYKAIIAACEITGANAIHPGFGFLSENATFARVCEKCGITFIGPSPDSIDMLGDKAAAKAAMKASGVPVIPGSDGAVPSIEEAVRLADEEIGYPLMVKASAGGGGRGIRLVEQRKLLSVSDLYLHFNEVNSRNKLCYRMLDLNSRVHFHEIEFAALVKQKFYRSCIVISADLCGIHSSLAHSAAQIIGHDS